MSRFVIKRIGGDYDAIGRELGIHPVLARLLANRGVAREEMELYVDADLDMLHDPWLMKDMDRALDLIIRDLEEKRRIRIIGDYDVDGVIASYILETTIRECFERLHPGEEPPVDTVLPHRVRDGYGVNPGLINRAHEEGVDTIITCDNGIKAMEEARLAAGYGMTFIVTDHHIPGTVTVEGEKKDEIPEADAVVDPMQADCSYPFKGLCGAGVAFKLSQLLYGELTDTDPMKHLEMAAFATVEDIMPLRDENRIMVKEGLKRLSHSDNPGLRALMEECGVNPDTGLDTVALSFYMGPCINAAGRMDDAMRARELLDAKDEKTGRERAALLKALNDERKNMTETAFHKAEELMEKNGGIRDVICVYLEDCHESIAGIVAGRLVRKYGHPAIVMCRCEDGIKGSGRSIECFDINEAVSRIGHLFTRFGGHRGACGFSMAAENDADRRARAQELAREINADTGLSPESFEDVVRIDMELPFSSIDMKLAKALESFAPFGNGFEKPLFGTRNVTVTDGVVMGEKRNAFRARVRDESGTLHQMIAFGDGDRLRTELMDGRKKTLVFCPRINRYQGSESIQLEVSDYV